MSQNNKEIKTYYKGTGLCGFGVGSNSAEVDVREGKILRTRPMRWDRKYRPEEMNPWKMEVRGKVFKPGMKSLLPPYSYAYAKKRAYSPNRIPFPMKRVDWDPDGNRNTQNRGKSKYVRITWDEATDIIAKEIKRQYALYGNYSILAQGDGHSETKAVHGPHGCQMKLLDLMGGYTMQARNPDSWEGWYWGAKHVWGMEPPGQGRQTNLFYDVSKNSQMILFWGCDPETTTWGWNGQISSRFCFWFTELGIRQVYICPDVNYGAAVHADKWIPIRPNTDLAMQFAIAYVWITEDTYDKEYLATHSIGFEKLKAHVLGEDDGIVKTPKWASAITGVPARTIKALARKWAREATTIAHSNGGSYIRSAYSHEPARMEVCLLAMQGLGKPGRNQLKFIEWQAYDLHEQNPIPRSQVMPNVFAAYTGYMYKITGQIIPKTLVPKAILSDKPLKWYGSTMVMYTREDQFKEYQYPWPEGGSQIHMIWSDTPCWSTCWNCGNDWHQALRSPKIDFVLAQHPWLENDCLFADIILPISTKYEQEDISVDVGSGSFNHIFFEGQCIQPVGEAKSDYEAVCEIAKKLGKYEEYTEGKSVKDKIRDGFEQSGVADRISFEEFIEKGYYMIPTADGWENDKAGFYKFYEDPASDPLGTPSGLIEIYSEALAEHFPDDQERKPVPQWIESKEESRRSPRAEKYPFLLVANHPRWRIHAQMDDISWLREIPTCKVKGNQDGYLYEPIWINPVDAAPKGIVSGDVVKMYNDRGVVLGGAYVTERIMPGVVYQDHGARLDPIVPGKCDRGGANNTIAPREVISKNCSGEVTSGYLVNIEKADIEALKAQYPDVFSRKFDGSGVLFVDEWLEKGR